ncbi:MAG: Hpt domain-containing protein, partial [Oscillospiraceae bacterium]|nr:Hpt domain-containing protein [Oscillospiraceae bacterium]
MGMGNDMMEAYLFEMHSMLEQLDDLILSSEQAKTFSQDAVNEIFRIMHTIKGSSAMMEFNSLMTIAHRIEDMFFVIREKTMDAIPDELKPDLFDLIFESIDFFRAEIEKIENDQPLSNDIDTFLNKINTFANKISGEAVEEPAAAEAAPSAADAAAPAASGELNAYGSATFPYGLQVFFDEGAGMENLRAMMLANAVKEVVDENQFDFLPPDVQLNPETASFIVDNGFFLRFKTEGDRGAAESAVRETGSVREFLPFDFAPGIAAAQAEQAAAPTASASEAPAANESAAAPQQSAAAQTAA